MRNMFRHMTAATRLLTDEQLIKQFMSLQTKHVSRHYNQRRHGGGAQTISEYSSIKKRMRAVNGFTEVKLSPARKRQHWHSHLRNAWNSISQLATDLEKDRERRRMMRLAA